MADPSRTEKATPKRREKARKEGSLLRVPDLDATILLWGNLFLFTAMGTATLALMGQAMAYYLRRSVEPGILEQGNIRSLALSFLAILMRLLLPFLAANFLLALGNQLAQHGLKISTEAIVPKFTRLNPANGFKRIFSARSLVEVLKSLMKFLVVAGVAYGVLGPRMPQILTTMKLPLEQSMAFMRDTLFVLYRDIMLAMVFLAVADFLYQRHLFEQGLKMTKQEVKDEAKDAEGNPEIKGRQKSMLFASAMRRITTQVPKASVVITNPTHFAVALRYDDTTAAPICVAMGVDHMAFRIRDKAKQSGVPVVENPPLARAIYRNVDLDKPIPADLYQAVAQVLAFVYRLGGAA
jgi:flagellar biosynthetic protein FlhB